jgi:hypothetical protein
VCQHEAVPSFAALQLGPPLRQPLLQQLFRPPMDLAEAPAISAAHVLEALRTVLLQNLNVRLLGEAQLRVRAAALLGILLLRASRALGLAALAGSPAAAAAAAAAGLTAFPPLSLAPQGHCHPPHPPTPCRSARWRRWRSSTG